MNKKTQDTNPTFVFAISYALAILLFSSYVFVYQVSPFDVVINDVILNLITALAALLTAIISTTIFFHYQPDDRPRIVWLNLMIGSWFWFLAEAIWAGMAFALGEVPTPSIADAAWVLGFVFFTIAIYHQYVLISPSWQRYIQNIIYGAWAAALIVPLLALSVMHIYTFENYINYFYPIADLGVGIGGLLLVYFFRGGMLMRPWLGMVVFGISDFLYAWAEQTGVYTWSVENNSLLTLGIDSSYLAAYLILGLGFLGHWTLVNYGLLGNRN